MGPAIVREFRCATCFLPVANPEDEFCSASCKQLSDDYEEQHVVYSSVQLAQSPK